MLNKIYIKQFSNNIKLIQFLNFLYFIVTLLGLISEYYHFLTIISIIKIFHIPILVLLYLLKSNNISRVYISALFFNWLIYFFFGLHDTKILYTASILFVFCRILFLVVIYKTLNFKSVLPYLMGCIPFLFLFLSLINLIFVSLNKGEFYMTLVHSSIMTLFGGFALSNFILKNDISSKFLMLSSLFFSINLITIGIKFYFIDYNILKPFTYLFFVLGQYTFYKFLILSNKIHT